MTAVYFCAVFTQEFRLTNYLTFPPFLTTSTLLWGLADKMVRTEETDFFCVCVCLLGIFYSLCSSCTHFLNGNSCQNVAGLQYTALALEPGRGQEARGVMHARNKGHTVRQSEVRAAQGRKS